MTREHYYEKGDYVKYKGNLSTDSNVLRDKGFGRIETFKTFKTAEGLSLYLLRYKESIYCGFQDISIILTEPKHLHKLGFQEVECKGKKKYKLDNITVSGVKIYEDNVVHKFKYCIEDFTNEKPDFETYSDSDGINLERFFLDYLDVTNLNDLLNFMEKRGIAIDKEAIVNC